MIQDYQRKLIIQMQRFRRLHFWSLSKEFSGSDYRMMAALYRCTVQQRKEEKERENRGICVSQIASTANMPMSAVSRSVANLEKKGIVGRCVDLRDRRNTLVFFTEYGKEHARISREKVDKFVDTVCEQFGKKETEILAESMERFVEIVQNELEKKTEEKKEKTMTLSKNQGEELYSE